MGMTKYICYCWPPTSNCKGLSSAEGIGHFDREHWSEISTNLDGYLHEGICVPDASQQERVHKRFDDALQQYMESIQEIRSGTHTGVASLRPLLLKLHASNAAILSYPVEVLQNPGSIGNGLVEGSELRPAEDDEVLSMAVLLCRSARRAAHELIESIRLDTAAYMFHHQAVIYDIAQEMTRLATEACAVGSEDYLDAMHPHVTSMMRQHLIEPAKAEPQPKPIG